MREVQRICTTMRRSEKHDADRRMENNPKVTALRLIAY